MTSKVKPTFSWQHIDAQLLVKKVDLMSSEYIVSVAEFGLISISFEMSHLYYFCLTKSRIASLFRRMIKRKLAFSKVSFRQHML